MIDVSPAGANHIQVFHAAGLSAHSILLTRNEALELLDALKRALAERQDLPALVPDD